MAGPRKSPARRHRSSPARLLPNPVRGELTGLGRFYPGLKQHHDPDAAARAALLVG